MERLWNMVKSYFTLNSIVWECEICCEEYDTLDSQIILSCGHCWCTNCLKQIVNRFFETGNCEILCCPNLNCAEKLSDEELQKLMTLEEYERYILLKNQTKCYLKRKGDIWCPKINCNGWMRKKGNQFKECSLCKNTICIKCKQIEHIGHPCMKKSKSCKKEKKTDNWIKKNCFECPNCFEVYCKEKGCCNVTCSVCKYNFNWKQIKKEKYFELSTMIFKAILTCGTVIENTV